MKMKIFFAFVSNFPFFLFCVVTQWKKMKNKLRAFIKIYTCMKSERIRQATVFCRCACVGRCECFSRKQILCCGFSCLLVVRQKVCSKKKRRHEEPKQSFRWGVENLLRVSHTNSILFASGNNFFSGGPDEIYLPDEIWGNDIN